ETLALFASLQAEPLPGVEDLVPAARTLMIRFRPERVSAGELAAAISGRDLSVRTSLSEHLVEIPVRYDGEDLDEVARLTGLSVEEVIRRHTESEFTVAFCGFAPGFGYLVGGDPALQVPRRQSPRTRIPAGSVALAGAFSGVYPQASPGGWQIIGTTPEKMWDLSRDPPALFQPGYRVRFVDLEKGGLTTTAATRSASTEEVPGAGEVGHTAAVFKVLAAPIPALFQDLGRFGQTGQGVSASGALDQGALKAANRAVGNPPDQACLEITLGGFSFEAAARAVVAYAGAPCPILVRDAAGREIEAAAYRPIAL
ncbi:MAG: carboxyltransferase domain-containing protein, partial [Rhizobiaceae bacterium]|nr:carboxyltransferase domain-containing protein [Rhizobiaceae bacterium]